MKENNQAIVHLSLGDRYYFCEVAEGENCEKYVPEHMLVYVQSGDFVITSHGETSVIRAGECVFLRKDIGVDKVKRPSRDGKPFRSWYIPFKNKDLHRIAAELPASTFNAGARSPKCPLRLRCDEVFFRLFAQVEILFRESPEEVPDQATRDALEHLLELDGRLANILFDFKTDTRIPIKEMMEECWREDLTVGELAHYAGRSLTPFKAEFYDLYGTTPQRWITARRLAEARKLIAAGEKPANFYLEIGFKNLSHFYTAFKKQYGPIH